jgi:phosphatidate cytidylyltransferase
MNPATWPRLFDTGPIFANPVTAVVTATVAALLLLTIPVIHLLARRGMIDGQLRDELLLRGWSWMVLAPLILGPILLGTAWTIVAIGLLGLLCYREYAQATGLFREKEVSLVVVLGILAVTFAALDHWYRLFVAVTPLTVGSIAIVAILRDQPRGYVQRVALGVLGFVLFGSCLGHLGYLANDPGYRPWMILTFLAVELNDIFAFVVGKTLGRRQLAPNTSPKKTVAGALGAVVLTTLLVVAVGGAAFRGTVLASPAHLVALGLLVAVLGQFGDLMLSSIKRDVGIKDMAATIPGHGGLLDRFDSLILVAPVVFHYINYFVGVATSRPPHPLTGG